MRGGRTVSGGGETGAERPKLLDEVARACRARQFGTRTVEAYVGWIRRFVLFHGRRHPRELDGGHVATFLTHLAVDRGVSASTQLQASSALRFLYSQALRTTVEVPDRVARPVRPRRLPVVLGRGEVRAVLDEVRGRASLPARLMYGRPAPAGDAFDPRQGPVLRTRRDRGESRQGWARPAGDAAPIVGR